MGQASSTLRSVLMVAVGVLSVQSVTWGQGQFWMPQPEKSQRLDATENGIPFLIEENANYELTLITLQGSDSDLAVRISVTNKQAEPLLVRRQNLVLQVPNSGQPSFEPLTLQAILSRYDRAKLPLVDYRAPVAAIPPGPPPVFGGSGFAAGYLRGAYIKAQADYAEALKLQGQTEAFNLKVRELNEERRRVNEAIDAEKGRVKQTLDGMGWTDFVAMQGKTVTKIALFELSLTGLDSVKVCLKLTGSGESCGLFKRLDNADKPLTSEPTK